MIIKDENNIIEFQIGLDVIFNPEIFCQSYQEKIGESDVILDCLKLFFLDEHSDALSLILNKLKADNQGFVFVAVPDQYNFLPESLIIVPTLKEAYDFIHLDRIQRDLGF
tara:strand:- start:6723 stop:7052 length:330 start_codon:yes stop_codon:yes gene_type:complete